MTRDEFQKLIEETQKMEYELLVCKGTEYAKDADVLSNFKSVGELTSLPPLHVWSVYFMKHIYAILSYVRDGKTHSNESIESRFQDGRNYLLLGLGLIKENMEKIIKDTLESRGGDAVRSNTDGVLDPSKVIPGLAFSLTGGKRPSK